MGCGTLPKPDLKGCYNLVVDGFGACTNSQTQKTIILSPEEWTAMKNGPGYWIAPEEIAKQKIFVLQLCEKSKLCSKDMIKETTETFDLFLTKPKELADKITKAKGK